MKILKLWQNGKEKENVFFFGKLGGKVSDRCLSMAFVFSIDEWKLEIGSGHSEMSGNYNWASVWPEMM